ncbi:MAG: hypothetical protein [Olavius algarvensis Gamma 3 endosymbiont]|nr:MAG: hypothetical protein [Olavius algarvensis Gamma 3 endosymbiont]
MKNATAENPMNRWKLSIGTGFGIMPATLTGCSDKEERIAM